MALRTESTGFAVGDVVLLLQSNGERRLHPGPGWDTGRVLGALVDHRVLALLGRNTVAVAAEEHGQSGQTQKQQAPPAGHYVIPVGRNGLH